MSNSCTECKKETSNPKFCSKSCAVRFNNKKNPKRKLEGQCADCAASIAGSRVYCDNCWKTKYTDLTKNLTKEFLFSKYGTYQAHAKIRGLARSVYSRTGLPRECKICGYNKHVQISHIKPVSRFSASDTLGNINSASNLQALCPNHHWEIDHGL